ENLLPLMLRYAAFHGRNIRRRVVQCESTKPERAKLFLAQLRPGCHGFFHESHRPFELPSGQQVPIEKSALNGNYGFQEPVLVATHGVEEEFLANFEKALQLGIGPVGQREWSFLGHSYLPENLFGVAYIAIGYRRAAFASMPYGVSHRQM